MVGRVLDDLAEWVGMNAGTIRPMPFSIQMPTIRTQATFRLRRARCV